MTRPKDKIVLWRPTFKLLSIINKITGYDYSQWLNLPIIMQRMPAIDTYLSNSTMATTLAPPTKKMSTFALSQN